MAFEMMNDPLVLRNDEESMKKRIKQYKIIIAVTFVAFIVSLLLFICAVFFNIGCPSTSKKPSSSASQGQLKFFHVSDLHLDLYYNSTTSTKTFCRSMPNTLNITPEAAPFDAPYGRVHCDSSKKLVDSALSYMKSLTTGKDGQLEFVLFTGDQVPHRIDKGFVNGTTLERVLNSLDASSKAIRKTLPNIPFLPLFGNNDLPEDYVLPKDKSFYKSVLEIWKPLILCDKCKLQVTTEKELQETFLVGGFYKAEIKASSIALLQLNTNYWSVRSHGTYVLETGDVQMNWLENQLKENQKAGKKVILSGHIPPGIDFYSGAEFWRQNYTNKYIQMVTKTYKDVVIGQLYGHIHKDDMKLQSANDQPKSTDDDLSFLLTAPGITPVYNNNPGFRIVTMDTKRQFIADYEQHYMDLVLTTQANSPVWLFDYSFGKKYLSHIPEEKRAITGKTIAQISERMINATDRNEAWRNYIQHRQVNYQPDPYSRYALYCCMTYVTKTNYDACLKSHPVTGG